MRIANKILAILLIVITNQISAIQIDSIKIIPPNPTSTDLVKVICYSEFSSTPCNLDTFSLSMNNFEISISAEHTVGLASAICLSVDTLTIGVLPTGEYNLTYYLMNKYNQFVYDTAYLNFEITENTGISNYKVSNQPISIYPNPAQTELFVETIPMGSEYMVFNSLGTVVKKGVYEGNSIPVSDLCQGIYYLKIQTQEQVYLTKFMKE